MSIIGSTKLHGVPSVAQLDLYERLYIRRDKKKRKNYRVFQDFKAYNFVSQIF